MAAVLAGALVVAGCGGDDTSVIVPAGGAAGAEPDSSLAGNGSGGGSAGSAFPDASTDVSSNPSDSASDVSMDDTGDRSDVSAPPDAVGETSVDAPSETVTPAEASLDAVADAPDGAPGVSKICAQQCETSDQCVRGASIYKPICDPATHRCVSCVDDLPCIASASLWTKSCTVDSGCAPIFGDYCVEIGGTGFCAFDSAKLATASCIGNPGTITIKKFGSDAQTVSVCAKVTTTCDLRRGRCEGACIVPCVDGGGCTNNCTVSKGGMLCNATTQRCDCAFDSDCAFPLSHCNLDTRQCECASSNDCAQDSGPALVCQ
jgi:hypothetical protein